MLRQISEDVRVNLKDRLREVREIIRQSRHDGSGDASVVREATSHLPPFPGKGIEGLLSHAASAFDEALSIAESFVPHERPIKVDGTTVKGLATYFPAGNEDRQLSAERLFRRDMYYLTKAVLAGLNIDNARIHEADFAAVHATMRKRHDDLLAALVAPGAGLPAIAATCSALLVECLNQRHGVSEGVRREKLQHDGDVTEVQVEVDETHFASSAIGKSGSQVARERRLSAAALGRKDRDDDTTPGLVAAVPVIALAHRGSDVAHSLYRVVDTCKVPFFDDLANACAQGVDQQRRVDAPAH